MSDTILLIGPRHWNEYPERAGGVVVLFEDLLSYCDEHNVSYKVVDTNKWNYSNKFIAYVSILYQILVKSQGIQNISLHGTANDYIFIAPYVMFISKILKKKYSLRKFAGNFIELYENYPIVIQKIISFTLKKSKANFFETYYLVNYFNCFNHKTFYFPNVRKKQTTHTSNQYKKRFVFLGAITKEKGIDVLYEASKLLSNQFQIDLYGTMDEEYTKDKIENENLTYKGNILAENVPKILQEYDVLLLPSFREGYPGVIIEAMSVGLPIIATNLAGIKEMVTDEMAILIDPKDSVQLKNAMERLSQSNYTTMREKALAQFSYFDSEKQTKLFLERVFNNA